MITVGVTNRSHWNRSPRPNMGPPRASRIFPVSGGTLHRAIAVVNRAGAGCCGGDAPRDNPAPRAALLTELGAASRTFAMAMRRLPWENLATVASQMSSEQRRAASVAGVAHALHDGYTDLIYIMLPLWQAEFGLTFAALGLLRSVLVGAMAVLQIPAGITAERVGAGPILAIGTALSGLGF